ncbi:MAG: hypothetical protein IPL76_17430 [Gemmatimonadetes bacterium]|nr:hypothetical protein [Gemmatimonadota bacterium]
MRTGLSQHTSLRQDLRINPRLYQAMDMLYMPMMDLQQHLKQELLTNPFLDLVEPEEEDVTQGDQTPTKEEEKEKIKEENETDWEEILLNGFEVQGGAREEYEEKEYTEPVTVETHDLQDHLREQLMLLDLTPRQKLLVEEFLGNLKDDGYLAAGLDEILTQVNKLLEEHADRAAGRTPVRPAAPEEADDDDAFPGGLRRGRRGDGRRAGGASPDDDWRAGGRRHDHRGRRRDVPGAAGGLGAAPRDPVFQHGRSRGDAEDLAAARPARGVCP